MALFMVCINIFMARICDVTLGTIRTYIIIKGKKLIAAIIAFFEVLIWFIVARKALNTEVESFLIPISYAMGYATGTLLGSIINAKFIGGIITIKVVTTNTNKKIIKYLRNRGYYCTIVPLIDNYDKVKKKMIIIQTKQKNLNTIIKIINQIDKKSYIIVSETKYVQNGILK